MKKLYRYIAFNIFISTFFVMLVLMGVESFIELANALKAMSNTQFNLAVAFESVLFAMPQDLYQLFPVGILIGSLLGLGRLASQSEIVVMWAAGFSKMQILLATLLAGLVMIIVMLMCGEWLAPKALKYMSNHRTFTVDAIKAIKTNDGVVWFREGNKFVHIDSVVSNNKLSHITQYEIDQQYRVQSNLKATLANFTKGQWMLKDVEKTIFFDDAIGSSHFDTQRWETSLDHRLLGLVDIDPKRITLSQLHRYLEFRKNNNLGVGKYDFVFWKRLLQPLACLVMLLISIPMIFGPLRTATMGLRIMAGVGIGIVFYITNEFMGPLSLFYQVPSVIMVLLPIMIFAFWGSFLLWWKL